MKAITTLILAALSVASFAADTPDQIAADYREKAAAALEKVNKTLETATVPLIAALVKSGDTAGADTLKEQMKAKTAGEPVGAPQPSAAALFKSYDAARTKALEPAQKAAVARINAILASAEGKKIDVVTALGKVRAEIESGKAVTASSSLAEEWHYFTSETNGRKMGTLWMRPGGVFELHIPTASVQTETGTWKPGKKENTYALVCRDQKWEVVVNGESATIERPTIGVRWLKVASAQVSQAARN